MMYPLEPSLQEMEKLMEETCQALWNYFKQLPGMKLDESRKGTEAALAQVDSDTRAPEHGTPYRELLDKIFREIIPWSFNTAAPGFMAYIPTGGLFESAIADFIAKSTNRYMGHCFPAPLLSQLEANVLKWFSGFIGYPGSSKGILTTGGSIANFTAVVIARSLLLGEDIGRGVLYASEQTHHSVWKAALGAGILPKQTRIIPTGDQYRINLDALYKQMEQDIKKGLKPFMIVGTAGTTDCGAIDPLPQLSDIARQYNTWFHIDAAYGGFFVLTEKGKKVLVGMQLADSVTLDPHKGLFLPYGIGALLLKNGENFSKVFSQEAQYITDDVEIGTLWDFSQMSMELTRDARGLRVWLPFKLYGTKAFKQTLEEKLELTGYVYKKLSSDPLWEILLKPQLSIIAFRCVPGGTEPGKCNEINREILRKVNLLNRVHLSGTVIKGKFVIRVCILSFRTHKEQADILLEDLNAARDEVLSLSCP